MSLTPGSRLDPYQILGPWGACGTGEGDRARDPRLERFTVVQRRTRGLKRL